MKAVIKTGGKQQIVSVGDTIIVELLGLQKGEKVEFKEVLFLDGEGEKMVGTPFVEGCVVVGEVLGEALGNKIQSVKYKPKCTQYKRFGHRQHYNKVKVLEIKK